MAAAVDVGGVAAVEEAADADIATSCFNLGYLLVPRLLIRKKVLDECLV